MLDYTLCFCFKASLRDHYKTKYYWLLLYCYLLPRQGYCFFIVKKAFMAFYVPAGCFEPKMALHLYVSYYYFCSVWFQSKQCPAQQVNFGCFRPLRQRACKSPNLQSFHSAIHIVWVLLLKSIKWKIQVRRLRQWPAAFALPNRCR